MNKVFNKLNQYKHLVASGIAGISLTAAVIQLQSAEDLASENAQLKRILQHHVQTISAGKEANRKLKVEKNSAIDALAGAYGEIVRQKTRKEQLEIQVRNEVAKGKTNQNVAERTIALLTVENLRNQQKTAPLGESTQGAFPLLPAQVIAEFIVAKLAIQTLRAEQKTAVKVEIADRALDECARNQPGLKHSDRQVIEVYMRQIQNDNSHTPKTSPANAAKKAYNALAQSLKERGLAAAQQHCRM
ncbi:MAG: hypothetical protein ABTQ34_07585 [Bdellovibrionales bacterium]